MEKAVREQLTKLSKGVVLMTEQTVPPRTEEVVDEVLTSLRRANLFLNELRGEGSRVRIYQDNISSLMMEIRDFYFPEEDE